MEKIIGDYRKTHRGTLTAYWIMSALLVLGLSLAAYSNERIRILSIVLIAFDLGLSLWATLIYLVIEPDKFRKKLSTLPEETRAGIISQYEKAPCFEKKWFLEEYLLFYNAKIGLLRFDEIRSAEAKGFGIELKLLDGKKSKIPLSPDENPAVIVAALRSKNPDISVLINGKVVESMEKRKSE